MYCIGFIVQLTHYRGYTNKSEFTVCVMFKMDWLWKSNRMYISFFHSGTAWLVSGLNWDASPNYTAAPKMILWSWNAPRSSLRHPYLCSLHSPQSLITFILYELSLHVSMVVWWWYCNCRNNDLPHTAYKKSQAHRFFHNDRTYFIYRNRKYIYCECYTFQSWLFLNPFIQCFDSAHVAIDVMLWSMYCQTCYNKYDNSPLC